MQCSCCCGSSAKLIYSAEYFVLQRDLSSITSVSWLSLHEAGWSSADVGSVNKLTAKAFSWNHSYVAEVKISARNLFIYWIFGLLEITFFSCMLMLPQVSQKYSAKDVK